MRKRLSIIHELISILPDSILLHNRELRSSSNFTPTVHTLAPRLLRRLFATMIANQKKKKIRFESPFATLTFSSQRLSISPARLLRSGTAG
jgi:hypothetical protein